MMNNVSMTSSVLRQHLYGAILITARRMQHRISVCLSVRPSVRLSDTRVLCDKTKQCTVYILTPHERAITLVC